MANNDSTPVLLVLLNLIDSEHLSRNFCQSKPTSWGSFHGLKVGDNSAFRCYRHRGQDKGGRHTNMIVVKSVNADALIRFLTICCKGLSYVSKCNQSRDRYLFEIQTTFMWYLILKYMNGYG